MDLSTILTCVIGATLGIVLVAYLMVPMVTDALEQIENPVWAAMCGLAVVLTIITIAVFPLYMLSKKND